MIADSSLWISLSYSATSAAVTVMDGPLAPGGTGWSFSTTRALVILVSEAMGTADSGPDCAAKPRAGTDTAPWPVVGQGRDGLAPGTTNDSGRPGVTTGRASGRLIRCAPTRPAATSTRTTTAVTTAHHTRR